MKKGGDDLSKCCSEEELFKQLEDVSPVVWIGGFKEGEAEKDRLKALVWTHWQGLIGEKDKSMEKRLAYALRLIFTFPPLLKRPSGFEWVTDELELGLTFPGGAIWEAIDKVKRTLKKRGRPKEREKDSLRFYAVTVLMAEGYSKADAIEKLVHRKELSKEDGGNMDTRAMHRSVERFEARVGKTRSKVKKLMKAKPKQDRSRKK